MNKDHQGILPLGFLVLVTLACQAITGPRATNTPPPTDTRPPQPTEADSPLPTATRASAGARLLDDDFTSVQWGTGTDADSSIEYANAALQFIVFAKNWFTWSTPDDVTYEDVHLEVTAINNDTDSTTALGILCNKQPSEESFYYFGITSAGEYAIARAAQGENDLFLTNDDKWATSDLITKNAASYRLGADCGKDALTLYVDGQPIDSVSDAVYTSGEVGLFVWSGEEATHTDVAFDDFLMTQLP